MPKWEYTFIWFSDSDWFEDQETVLESLNVAGDMGWEIINISQDTGTGTRFLMKRKLVKQKVKKAAMSSVILKR